ncbi:ABC transporter ATP-binding protein [Sulfurovum sp. NBC37-1]|uniref:ABC transporter ATP-binding protein n=1 Tax=Sulfurovum sp. (strain NBC37-1) TaxID=387093 RepID=UPI00015876B7|nr:ABC transporter ATP-binding protein [Sulfurovum sp. NBC37-1]BAF71276.1 ABC transporter, ATP-binding protein [Sulfurovum sp. NBC37-1]
MSQPLLEATGISHSFDYPLFSDIHFSIAAKQSAAIVGRSGSGKSTLLHIFSTFLQPDSGNVTLFEHELYTLKDSEIESLRRYDVGIIFQFHYLFKGMSALENISVATMLSGETIDNEILKKLQIDHLMAHKTSELSGGEQQRVSIARVLSKKPRIIFADEPTGNLDKETAELVMEVLAAYIKEHDAALVLVTHDESMAARCDAIYKLKDKTLEKSA